MDHEAELLCYPVRSSALQALQGLRHLNQSKALGKSGTNKGDVVKRAAVECRREEHVWKSNSVSFGVSRKEFQVAPVGDEEQQRASSTLFSLFSNVCACVVTQGDFQLLLRTWNKTAEEVRGGPE